MGVRFPILLSHLANQMPITICQIQNTKNRYFSIFLLEVNQISSCMLLPLPHTHFLPRHQEYPSTFLAVRVESTASTIKKWTKRLVRGKMLLKNLSTWGIGGPCKYVVQVFDRTQLISAIRLPLLTILSYYFNIWDRL